VAGAAAVGITLVHGGGGGSCTTGCTTGSTTWNNTGILHIGETADLLGAQVRAVGDHRQLHLVSAFGSNALAVKPDGTVDVPQRMTARNLAVYGDLQAERWQNLVASHTSTNPFVPPSAAALGTAYRTLSNMIVAASFAAGGISNVIDIFGTPTCNLADHFLTTSPDEPADVEVNSVSTGTLRVAALGFIDAPRYLNLSLDWKLDATQSLPASAYSLQGAFSELSNMGRVVGGVYKSSETIEWRHATTDALLASLDVGTAVFTAAGGYSNLPILSSISTDVSVASNSIASVALVKNIRDQVTSLVTSSFSKAVSASNAAMYASNAARGAADAMAAFPDAPFARIRMATNTSNQSATLTCITPADVAGGGGDTSGLAPDTMPLLRVLGARLLCVEGYDGLVQDVMHASPSNASPSNASPSNVPPTAAAVAGALRVIDGRAEFASNLSVPLGMLVAVAPTRAVQAEWASNAARWASNEAACLSNRTAPRAVYASNVASVTSNTVRWASNLLALEAVPTARWASNGIRVGVWGSNTAAWASNVAKAASNLADETLFASNTASTGYAKAAFGCNAGVYASNAIYPTQVLAGWASNLGATALRTAAYASNAATTVLNAPQAADVAFSSNAAAWGSNTARWASNAWPAVAFGSNAAAWGSNAARGASVTATFASNATATGSNALALLSNATTTSGTIARRADLAAAWSSNAIAGAGGASALGWTSNELGGRVGPAASWASNAAASNAVVYVATAIAASNASAYSTAAFVDSTQAWIFASNAWELAGMASRSASNTARKAAEVELVAVWASNAGRYASNWITYNGSWVSNAAIASSNSVWSVGAAALASNTSVWTSNTLVRFYVPSAAWASNTAAWASNASVSASNVAVAARTAAAWASNLARADSVRNVFGSNAAAWASNAALGAVASSSGTPFASNAAAWASNTAAFGCNAGAWTSNELARVMYASNGVDDRILAARRVAAEATAVAAAASETARVASGSAVTAHAQALEAKNLANAITLMSLATRADAQSAVAYASWASNGVGFSSNIASWAWYTALWSSNAGSFASNAAYFSSNTADRTWRTVAATSNTLVEILGIASSANQTAGRASNAAARAAGYATDAIVAADWASNVAMGAMDAMREAKADAAAACNLAISVTAVAADVVASVVPVRATAEWASNTGLAASNEAFKRSYVRTYSNAPYSPGADAIVVGGSQLAPGGALALQLSNADAQSLRMALDGSASTGGMLARGGADLVLAARDGAVVRLSGDARSTGPGSFVQTTRPGGCNAVLVFPPAPGASTVASTVSDTDTGGPWAFTLCNVMYGEGRYAAHASSTNGSNATQAWRAFSYSNAQGADASGVAWTTRMGYTTTSGHPNVPPDQRAGTGVPTTLVDGVTYAGDWLQLLLPPDRPVTPPEAYTLAPRLAAPSSGVPDGQPRRWLLAGSSDGGVTWRMIDATYATTDYVPQNATISVTCPRTTAAAASGTPMNAFRLIVLRVSVSAASASSALFVPAEVAALRVKAAPVVASLAMDADRAVFTGSVGLGTATPVQRLDVAGSVTVSGRIGVAGVRYPAHALELGVDDAAKPASGMWTVLSDKRLKESIQPVDLKRCYDIVRQVPLKRYRWREDVYPTALVPDRTRLGWIAQDVAVAFPKAVRVNKAFGMDDCLSLNSDQLMAALYGAVQHMQMLLDKKADAPA
jgi:hypothetical protein